MSGETLERARHRWREILPQLGIATSFLTNKHGPCPLCGGRDRYRFDDKDGAGTYFCNQCGPGTGLILLRKKHGWDFKTAVSEIDRIIGRDPRSTNPIPRTDKVGREATIKRLLAEATTNSDIVTAYLKRRGLSVTSPVLRGHWRCPYFENRQLVGTYPAVLAPIRGPDGSLQSVQRIYVADLGERARKKSLPPVDTITGAAVRAGQRVLLHVLPPGGFVVARLREGKPGLDVLPGGTGLIAGRKMIDVDGPLPSTRAGTLADRLLVDRRQILRDETHRSSVLTRCPGPLCHERRSNATATRY